MEGIPAYWTNPYQTEFEVNILQVRKMNEIVEITIDEPVVRPAGGGQAGDRGALIADAEQIQFFDTKSQGVQTILIADEAPEKNRKYTLVVDWNWRYSMMKNHTAEHLFVSTMLQNAPGLTVSELWIDGEKTNLSLEGRRLESRDLLSAERKVQEKVEAGIDVKTEFVKSERIGEEVRVKEGAVRNHEKLRVIKIGGSDQSACSGMHVKNTGEIGIFKVTNYQIYKEGARVEFLTSSEAVRELTKTYNAALQRKDAIPFEMEQLGHILDKYCELKSAHEEMLEKVKRVVPDLISSSTVGEIRIFHESLPGFSSNALREAALNLEPEKPALVLLFSPGDTSYLVARSVGIQEASFYVKEVVESLGGKGGGRGEFFAGGFSGIGDPQTLYQDILTRVMENI